MRRVYWLGKLPKRVVFAEYRERGHRSRRKSGHGVDQSDPKGLDALAVWFVSARALDSPACCVCRVLHVSGVPARPPNDCGHLSPRWHLGGCMLMARGMCDLCSSSAAFSTDLQRNVGVLMAAPDNLPLRETGLHHFDIYHALDIDDVATIAVAHNPALRALRLRVGVAEAQAFQAGLLPNPQFSFDHGFLVDGPGLTNSMLIGLAQDILPLLTLSARKAEAAGTQASVELDLLWQEWQVVSQVRTLFVRATALRQQLSILQRSRQLFQERYSATSTAMNRGDGQCDAS